MESDANNAAPSAAPEQEPAAVPSLASLSTSELESWRLHGSKPSTEDSSSTAESTPAEPAEQAASTDAQDTPPASEPGTPAKKKNADARVQELLQERHELRTRLEALERGTSTPPPPADVPQAASSPAAVHEAFPDFDTWSAKPGNEDKPYEEYIDARTDHRWSVQQQEAQRVHTVRTRVSTYAERCQAAFADPATLQALSPAVLALQPIDALPAGAPVGALNVVAQEILESSQAPRLMRHFSEQPHELAALQSASPATILRTIAKLEARFDAGSPSAPSSAAPSPSITKAPEPPTTLGARSAAPLNEAEAALARGDFNAYRNARNREELAARA